MFGGMAGRRLLAQFRRRAGRLQHPRKSRRGRLDEVAYTSWPRRHFIGIGAGVIYLVAHFLHASSFPNIARLAAIAVIIMLLLTVFSQFYVMAHLADLRNQMGSVDRTPATDPLRAEFDKLHQWSVWVESAVLLLGIAAVYLTVRAK